MSRWHFARFFSFFLLASNLLTAIGSAQEVDPSSRYRDEVMQSARDLHLAGLPEWRVLLHYRPTIFGGIRSELTSPAFFNAPDGATDPEGELVATLKRFFEPSQQSVPSSDWQHSQCLFVDRYRWLKERLHFDPRLLPEQPCPRLEQWRKDLSPESATVVFSSYFMNNPSSAFGHTLLRLNHRNRKPSERLLDLGINYAANPTTSNAVLYSLMGIFGGFDGTFSNIPYFLKVQEYNDIESRDLWEYDLALTPEELDRLLSHLWTLAHFRIPYYFFGRNCSYMILTLLDAARPELALARDYRWGWVIPADTIRSLMTRKDLIREVRVRPAIITEIQGQREGLSTEESQLFEELLRRRKLPTVPASPTNPSPSVAVVDLATDYLRFRKTKEKEAFPREEGALLSDLLALRAALPSQAQVKTLPAGLVERSRPDRGHGSTRVGFGGVYDSRGQRLGLLDFRPAFHDLNAATVGYPATAEIELAHVQVRYSFDRRSLQLERFDFFNLLSVIPYDPLFPKLSWSARLAAEPVRDLETQDTLEYKVSIGGGGSFAIGGSALAYALLQGEVALSSAYIPNYRILPGAQLGTLVRLGDRFGIQLTAIGRAPFFGSSSAFMQGSGEIRYSPRSEWDVRVGVDAYSSVQQTRFTAHVYF